MRNDQIFLNILLPWENLGKPELTHENKFCNPWFQNQNFSKKIDEATEYWFLFDVTDMTYFNTK